MTLQLIHQQQVSARYKYPTYNSTLPRLLFITWTEGQLVTNSMYNDNGQPQKNLPVGHQIEPHKDERITNDVRREAEEAMRLYSSMSQPPAEVKPESGIFRVGMLLRVEVQGSNTPMYVVPKTEMIVGRADPSSGEMPEIDLTSYAAYQMGISRRHAIIKWDGNTLHLVDQGSRNGTFVNGKKAVPNQALKLHDGDEMRLGKMSLRLYFREQPSANESA